MVLAMIRREAGPVEQAQRRPRVSKLRAKGLSGCPRSRQQPRQPDGGPGGQIKDHSHEQFTKRNKQWAKAIGRKKSFMFAEKRKDAYTMLQS